METSPALAVVWPAARPHRRRFAVAGTLVLAETAAVLVRPWPLALAVDHALSGTAAPAALPGPLATPEAVLLAAGAATVGVSALLGALRLWSERLAEGTAEEVGHAVRTSLLAAMLRRPLRWHDRHPSGELVTRLTTDVGRVLDALVAVATTVVPDVVLLLAVLALVAGLDPQLALVGLSVLPVLAWLSWDQRRRVRRAETGSREAAGQLAARAQDLLRHVRAVQAFGRADVAARTFETASRAQVDREVASIAVASRWSPLADGVLAVGTAAVLVVGGHHVLSGTLTVGALLVVLAYLRDLYAPVRSLTRLSGLLARADVSARRIAEVLGTAEEQRSAPAPSAPAPRLRRHLEMRGVAFSYRPDRPVLRDFDLRVEAGEVVCLVGPSGAGKSTVLHLLLGLHEADRGRVLLDGVDQRSCAVASWRTRFAFLPQDPWLLDDTLAANVAVGRRGATRAEVAAACRLAHVDEFADRLPAGLDTRLGEDALRLSGGQRRRVALARAVVSSAPALLLDEPTASLDGDAAEAVLAAMADAVRGRTALVVTHDPRVLALADRVVHVERLREEPARLRLVPPAPDALGPLGSANPLRPLRPLRPLDPQHPLATATPALGAGSVVGPVGAERR